MSVVSYTPDQNDIRYDVTMINATVNDFTVYHLVVMDLAIGIKYQLAFRFSQVKRLHAGILRKYKMMKDRIPELPKTHSFGIWNRTNKDHRKIQERRRQLEFYFYKLFNSPVLRGLPFIKTLLLNSAKITNRSQSTLCCEIQELMLKRSNSLPLFVEKFQNSI